MSKITSATAVTEASSAAIAALSGDVNQQKVLQPIVDAAVAREVSRRSTIVNNGLAKHKSLLANVTSYSETDANVYGADGSVVSKGYSKDRLDALTRAKDKLAKFEAAFNPVLADGTVEAYAAFEKFSNENY